MIQKHVGSLHKTLLADATPEEIAQSIVELGQGAGVATGQVGGKNLQMISHSTVSRTVWDEDLLVDKPEIVVTLFYSYDVNTRPPRKSKPKKPTRKRDS